MGTRSVHSGSNGRAGQSTDLLLLIVLPFKRRAGQPVTREDRNTRRRPAVRPGATRTPDDTLPDLLDYL